MLLCLAVFPRSVAIEAVRASQLKRRCYTNCYSSADEREHTTPQPRRAYVPKGVYTRCVHRRSRRAAGSEPPTEDSRPWQEVLSGKAKRPHLNMVKSHQLDPEPVIQFDVNAFIAEATSLEALRELYFSYYPNLTGILANLFMSSLMNNTYIFAAISVLKRRFTLRTLRQEYQPGVPRPREDLLQREKGNGLNLEAHPVVEDILLARLAYFNGPKGSCDKSLYPVSGTQDAAFRTEYRRFVARRGL
ncbi:hypothetical protein B7463_g3854, partial [Scytalidium lignicola]